MIEERSAVQAQELPRSRSSRDSAADVTPLDNNPFPGPRSYRQDQKKWFFGRDGEIEKLTSLVLSTSAVLLYAKSGSGKSSLLHAGLVPSLENFDYLILPTVRFDQVDPKLSDGGADTSQPNPFAKLLCVTVLSKDKQAPDACDLKQLTDYLEERDGGTSTLLILDQFEELFTDEALWQERAAFLAQLRRALDAKPWLHAVLAIRSDYLGNLLPHERDLPGRMLIRCGLESLREQAAREAIEKAFKSTDVPLGPAELDSVLARLLNIDVGRDGLQARGQSVNLIQMQILCRRLWQEKYEAGSPSVASARDGSHVLKDSKVDLAEYMRSFVDEAVSSVVSQTQADEGVVRRWLEDRLITRTGRRNFYLVENDQTAGLPEKVLDALEDARLIQLELEQRNQLKYAELTHDSMVAAVQASNERWVGTRLRARRWLTAGLTVALLALLALFPFLRAPTDETLLTRVSGSVDGSTSSVPFPPAPNGDVAVVHVSLFGAANPGATVRVVAKGKKQNTVARAVVPTEGGRVNTAVNFAIKTTQKASYTVAVQAHRFLDYEVTVRAAPVLNSLNPDRFVSVDSPLFAVKLDPSQPLYMEILNAEVQRVWAAQTLMRDRAGIQFVVESPGQEGYAVLWVNSLSDAPATAEVTGQVVEQGPELQPGMHTGIRSGIAAISSVNINKANAPFIVDTSCRNPGGTSLKVIDNGERSAGSTAQSVPTGSVLVPSANDSEYRLILVSDTQSQLNCRVDVRSYAQQRITTTGNRAVKISAHRRFNAYPIRLPSDAAIIVTNLSGASASLDCLSGNITESGPQRLLAFAPKNHDCVLSVARFSGNPGKPVSFPLQIVPISGR